MQTDVCFYLYLSSQWRDLKRVGIVKWRQLAQERDGWRRATREAALGSGATEGQEEVWRYFPEMLHAFTTNIVILTDNLLCISNSVY